MAMACVLISDITGSTQLYEVENTTTALSQISNVLARMRQIITQTDGYCVKSQGDDVLSYFTKPDDAFQAAMTMIHEDWHGSLSVHVGLYHGDILSQDGDIYGPPVNTAARLASLAKPGEILLGDECFDLLAPAAKLQLALIGELPLKGKREPTRVYSCSVLNMSEQTVIFSKNDADRASRTESARFTYQDKVWQIGEGESLSIGRSDKNQIVLQQAWVSRKHSVVSVRRGQLEYTDHSSTGSVLRPADGKEIMVHRQATLLNGDGIIYLGSGVRTDKSSAVAFDTQDMSIRLAPD
ncbi:MAG: adenylate cyclase [Paracoccaceae bacterium]|jgi:adenylate cyclase